MAARASRRSVASPGRCRGRTSSRTSDQRGIRRSTPSTLVPRSVSPPGSRARSAARRPRISPSSGSPSGTGSAGASRRGDLPGVQRRRQPLRPPAQHVLQPGQPVPRAAGPGQLVPLPREQQQLRRDAAALELDVEAGALLERAAPVLLGVDDQRRRRDAVRVRQRALLGDPRRIGAEVLVGEDPPDVGGADEADRVGEGALADGRRRTASSGRSAGWSGTRRTSRP